MLTEGAGSIEILKNNARTIGGVLGAETAFFEGKAGAAVLPAAPEGETYFQDRATLDLDYLTFSKIEKTKLGRAITAEIKKLEKKIRNLEGNIADITLQ